MRGEKTKILLGIILVTTFLVSTLVSAAGIGLKWGQESVVVPENKKACMTYYVYNPWETDTYGQIILSEEMNDIVTSYDAERKLIPAHTSSSEALPMEFCFKTPQIYEKDCWIGDSLICKQECKEEMKIYAGQVEAIELSEEEFASGEVSGSRTQMSISAPIKVGVSCNAHSRNFSLIYLVVAVIALVLLIINVKHRKGPKSKNIKKKK